jgi:hypothetical protein
MSKQVSFRSKPTKTVVTPNPDTWVESHKVEGNKRLTVDLPVSLHTRIKTTCAARGVKMVDEIRAMLEERFPGTT